ncbi:MAG: AsmA-like C-terminal domain-containing protein [Thermodesulfobacteriota bacterium]|nr:AsmA-like C-terminal domain-containing protein [Thermodesulfobacteriota bacterium]
MTPNISTPKSSLVFKLLVGVMLLSSFCILSSGVLLKRGITFHSFSIANVSVSDFSLQWREKLELVIGSLVITKKNEKETAGKVGFSGSTVKSLFQISRMFSKVSIKELQVAALSGAFHFDQTAKEEPGFLNLHSDDFSFQSTLSFDKKVLLIDITEATAKQLNAKASGTLRFDTEKAIIKGILTADIAASFPISIEFIADQNQISFTGKENGKITTITPLVDLFGLNHDVQRWITDYLHASRYHLKIFKGIIPWDKPQTLLNSLYAEVRMDNCEYTFASGLEAVKSSHTDVVFNEGVLAVTPHGSTYYGQDGKDSWLHINFNDPHAFILTAYIVTHAQINEDIAALLKYYHIPLPFKQTQGRVDTDLTLTINLHDGQVSSKGIFIIKKGEIEAEKKRYAVNDVKVSLINSDITLEHGSLSFGKIFTADISGEFSGASERGDFNILLQQFRLGTKGSLLQLDDSEPKPLIQVHIQPDNNSLDVTKSFWKLDEIQMGLAAFATPFSFAEFSGILPPTLLNLPIGVSANISGPFSLKYTQIKLQCELLQFNLKDIVLENPGIFLEVEYKNELSIRYTEVSHWRINNIHASIHPSEITYEKNILTMKKSHILYGDFFDSEISGSYDMSKHFGDFLLQNLKNKKQDSRRLFTPKNSIPLHTSYNDKNLIINIPDLGLTISTGKNKNWSAHFKDLSILHPQSKILQRFKLDAGSLEISSDSDNKTYTFSATIPYRYALLVTDNKPVYQYTISGKIDPGGVTAVVNEDMQIVYGKELTITSRDIAYNLPAIMQFAKEQSGSKEANAAKKRTFRISFDAENSGIYLDEKSQLLADHIHFDNKDGSNSLVLTHGEGEIDTDIDGQEFSLSGNRLNDAFMTAIVPGAKFQGGQMSVAAKGSFTDFSVLFKIENTNLKKFQTVNNILALLNTIPSLIRFSLPEFTSTGLPVSSAVLGLTCKDGYVLLKSLSLQSSEFDIAGNGWIDFNEKTIDIDLNVITRVGANISKIPLAGYVLAGDEKRPSVTVKISGDLLKPEVTNSVFRKVASTPLSILSRALTLPVHLVKSMNNSDDKSDKRQTESTE